MSDDALGNVVDHLNSLATNELRAWLYATLHGLGTGGGKDDSPSETVADIFYRVDRQVRIDLQILSYEALDEILARANNWSTDAAINLLLLADPLWTADRDLSNSRRRDEALDALVRIASMRRTDSASDDIRIAATQATIALDAKRPPRFWFDQYRLYGPAYAPFVVEALVRDDVALLSSWLCDSLPDTALEEATIDLLPFAYSRNGAAGVATILSALFANAGDQTIQDAREFAEDWKIPPEIAQPNTSIRFALANALDAAGRLLQSMKPGTELSAQTLDAVIRSLSSAREVVMANRLVNDEAAFKVIRGYVHCADAALWHGALVARVFDEFGHFATPDLLQRVATYVIRRRSIDPLRVPEPYRGRSLPGEKAMPVPAGAAMPTEISDALLAALQSTSARELSEILIAADRESFEDEILAAAAS